MPEPAGETKIPVYVPTRSAFIGLTPFVTENGSPASLIENTSYYAVTPGKSSIGLTGGGTRAGSRWEFYVVKTDGTIISENKYAAFDYTIPENALYISLIANE